MNQLDRDFLKDNIEKLAFSNSSRHSFNDQNNQIYATVTRINCYLDYMSSMLLPDSRQKIKLIRFNLSKNPNVLAGNIHSAHIIVQIIARIIPEFCVVLERVLAYDTQFALNYYLDKKNSITIQTTGNPDNVNLGLCAIHLLEAAPSLLIDNSLASELFILIQRLIVVKKNNNSNLYRFLVDTFEYDFSCAKLDSRLTLVHGGINSSYVGHSQIQNISHVDGASHYAFGHQINHLISREILVNDGGVSHCYLSASLVANQFLALYECMRHSESTCFNDSKLLSSILDGSYSGLLGEAPTMNMEAWRQYLIKGKMPIFLNNKVVTILAESLQKFIPKLPKIYVCLYIRDGGFKGDYNNQLHANSDRIHSMDTTLSLVRSLIERGISVIRIGDSKGEPLPIRNHMYWEYSHSQLKNDVADIVIPMKSVYILCGGAGGGSILPMLLGRPSFHYDYPIARRHFCNPSAYIVPLNYSKDNSLDLLELQDIPYVQNAKRLWESGYCWNSIGGKKTIIALKEFEATFFKQDNYSFQLQFGCHGVFCTPIMLYNT